MPSIELKEEEETALNYAKQDFDGNLSKFLRVAVKEYDNNCKKRQTVIAFQTIAFLLISICFLLIGISVIVPLISVLLPAIFALCGIYLIVYVWVLLKESRKTKGRQPLWTLRSQ